MGKSKQILILLLAVLLLMAGGLLPFLTAAVQDAGNRDIVQYGNMNTLELTLRGKEQEPLDMLTKLLLLQVGATVELAENEVNGATHKELLVLANNALADYYNAGLLLWNADEMGLQSYVPFFLYMPGMPEVNAQFWLLELIDPEGFRLGIVVDQETGKLVAMECDSSAYMEEMGYDRESYAAVIAEVYFSSLGLEPFTMDENYYDYADGVSVFYYLEKEGYEIVTVQISVHSDGFWVTTGPV